MRLGIDLDGVVADFNEGWTSRYNAEFGTSYTPDMITTWNAMTALGAFASDDDFWEWARNDDGPGLFRHLPLIDGAKEALDRLAINHDIVIITTKPAWAAPETFEWIGEHRLPTSEVHITYRKWLVDCDVYLDDSPHALPGLVKNRPTATVCRFEDCWGDP